MSSFPIYFVASKAEYVKYATFNAPCTWAVILRYFCSTYFISDPYWKSNYENINMETKMTETEEKIKKILNDIRPMLQQDGGDVEFISFENKVVKVRLKGACTGCAMSQITLKNGIERVLVKQIPEIKYVENIE